MRESASERIYVFSLCSFSIKKSYGPNITNRKTQAIRKTLGTYSMVSNSSEKKKT
jgi:hypothetical protein